MAVTIRDVAALAGVSPSTVSRTCKDHPSISKETKDRVRRAMAKLGYEPGIAPAAEKVTRVIGVILPPSAREVYENAFYLEAMRGISQFCNNRQYVAQIITGQDDSEVLQVVRTMVSRQQADGFIVMYSKQEDPIVDYLYNEGLLYVLIGKAYRFSAQTVYIDNDNLQAAQEAADYLIGMGHRRIAFIGCDSNLVFAADRRAGYQLSMMKHGIPLQPEFCLEVPFVPTEDEDSIRQLLTRPDRPTAVVVSDDIIAVALERACMRCGLRVPEDLSIISFNNSLFARLASPQLTSVDVSSLQLGLEAASQMINHIENPDLLATHIIVPHHLIERDSCRPLQARD